MCFIDGETERTHDLVRVVETHAILSGDPIPVPLRFADELARLCELLIRCTGIHGGLDGLMGLCDSLACNALKLEGVVTDRLDARLSVSALSSWHLRQDSSVVFNGFVIQCDVYFWPFSLMYGIWQSTQVTPASAWTLVAQVSKSGCCALSIGAWSLHGSSPA